MDRQFIFQDLRHAQVFNQVLRQFDTFNPNPLSDIGFERVKGRSFRLVSDNQVDEIIAGMALSEPRFRAVANRCDEMSQRLPAGKQQFFYDNLSCYAHYMAALSNSLGHFLKAYREDDNPKQHLAEAHRSLKEARSALLSSQHGAFDDWYGTDRIFNLDEKISALGQLIDRH